MVVAITLGGALIAMGIFAFAICKVARDADLELQEVKNKFKK